jgi:hypothetical protein
MKANQKFIRQMTCDSSGMVHIPRLLALTIPFLFVIFIHIANVFVEVPSWLLEPIVQIAILFTGAVLAVLGLQYGILPVFLLVMVVWGITIYYYAQYIANWI